MSRDLPIIFSAPMIRALLDGRKTQTRRIITKPAALDALGVFGPSFLLKPGNVDLIRYAAGDRLWVRENWGAPDADRPGIKDGRKPRPGDRIVLAANDADAYQWQTGHPGCADFCWRPSIHMPRWASRLTLIVEGVKVERLQDISENDALAEGCPAQTYEELAGMEARGWFRDLWDSINGADAWDANPFVVAISFRVEHANIDALKVAAATAKTEG